MLLRFAIWIATVLLVHVPLRAGAAAPTDSDRYTIGVLTFGPGDHPFLKFGHNALLVQDRLTERQLVYNFGTFDLNSRTLIGDFLEGRLEYWLSVTSLDQAVKVYQAANRSVTLQLLQLSTAQEAQLVRSLRHNALPENRAYKYDYYADNCSTRVRDAIDEVLGGRLREQTRWKAAATYRDHTLRLTADNIPIFFLLHIAMGAFIDQPITRWQEMFIPEVLRQTLADTTVMREGRELALVSTQIALFEADRAPEAVRPPQWVASFAVLGLFIGASFAAAARWGGSGGRAAVHVGLGLFALAAGLLGSSFAFFWAATDHVVAHANHNLLLCPPWALGIAFSVPFAAFGRRWARAATRWLAVSCVGAALVAALIKALPFEQQQNWEPLGLILPCWLGMALATRRLHPPPR